MQLRAVAAQDRQALEVVESLSTPGLRYVSAMFDEFRADGAGEFMLVEDAGAVPGLDVLGFAKFSVVPDGTAWLEALRVLPQAQGRGLGKRMYERFFELAQARGITTMRMYTGLTNLVSAGLARHFGFALEETFDGYTLPVSDVPQGLDVPAFKPVLDPVQAQALLMPLRDSWGPFVVLNRTFYQFTPELCAWLAREGMVYAHGADVVVLGARFKPLPELHLGLFAGSVPTCLKFAGHELKRRGGQKLCCLFPADRQATAAALKEQGFTRNQGQYIVMKVTL